MRPARYFSIIQLLNARAVNRDALDESGRIVYNAV